MVRYAILGSVELFDGQRRVAVGGRRQMALLAALLINANQAVSADRLIDALWGDLDRAGALKRLQVAIARLRRALDPDGAQGESALRTIGGGYLLAVGPGDLDAEVFQTRMHEGRRALEAGEAERARDVIGKALGLWRGPALADVAYEEFAQPEIRRLEELRLAALEVRIDCALHLGEHSELIGELKGLVDAHPGRERLVAQLMLALYRCGRQGDALAVYARTRAYLSGELGLEPGPALQALQGEILTQSPGLQPAVDARRSSPGMADRPTKLSLPRALCPAADTAFVGRDMELERLIAHWTNLGGGQRAAVLVCGEAGVGKTRLVAEFAGRMYEEGALVLYGRCDEGLAVPYQPLVEALGPYVRAVGRDRLRAELGELAGDLGRLLPELVGLAEPVRSDPQSERFALFEAVAALIETATRRRRALLVLDDLHWATSPTLLMVRHLLRCERQPEVLLLCTYRRTELELGEPLAQLVADVQRDASAQLVNLAGLAMPAIATLVEQAVGHALDDRAAPLVRGLAAQTGGNPFFLRELLADVADANAMLPGGERVSLEGMAARLEVPEGLRHVICQRIARLSAAAGRVLRVAAVAAVADATFSFTLLERLLGEESGVLDALDEALAAGLLAEAGHGEYVFAHALVRQTIYGQLSASRRIRLHRQVGEALEALGDDAAHLDALAHHFVQAIPDGQGAKAAAYALAAGRHAVARLGYEEAAAHYERALQALAVTGHAQNKRRGELLLALGEARWHAGELDKARHAYEQAAELADTVGNHDMLARAALGFCGPHRFEAAVTVVRPIAALLGRALASIGEQDGSLRAQLMGRLAATLAYADVDERQPALARRALEMARRVGDSATLADVLASALWADHGPDAVHGSRALSEELARLAAELDDRRLRGLAHRLLLDLLLELGDIEAVDHELEALQRLIDPRERYFTWLLAVVQANRAHLEGRLEDCECLAHSAVAHRLGRHDETAGHFFTMQILLVRAEQGRLKEILDAVEYSAAQYPYGSGWRCVLAYAYARLECTKQARQALEAVTSSETCYVPRDGFWLANMLMLCEAAIFLGDVSHGQLLHKQLLPYADRCAVVVTHMCHGSVSRALGRLATLLSHHEDAEQYFQQALMMNARIRSPLWVAHTEHDYARMLLTRRRTDDAGKALVLLDNVLGTAQQLGLSALSAMATQARHLAEDQHRNRAS